MRIIVFSDSHGRSGSMRDIMMTRKDADMFIHLGDGNREFERVAEELGVGYAAVRGNCDTFASGLPLTDEILLGGKRVMFTHGHVYNVKYDLSELVSAGFERNADVVLFGHTHVPYENCVVREGRALRLLNPGSISMGGSYGVVDISPAGILTGIARI